jgi:hypothetical protein
LPTNLKGWSGKRPLTGPTISYSLQGVGFMTHTAAGQLSSRYERSIALPPTLAEAQSDPLLMLCYSVFVHKTGMQADLMGLVDPSTDASTLATLNRPDLVKESKDALANERTIKMLMLYQEPDGCLLIYYYLESPTGRTVQMEREKEINGVWYLEPNDADENDNRPINFFTAFYDTVNGISNDINVTP